MVVACTALVVALGGTGYAAIALPRNSVGSKQLRSNAVTGAKVRNGSLQAKDFAGSQLPRGPRGPQGPPGPAADAAGGARTAFASRDPVGGGTGSSQPIGSLPTDVLALNVPAGTDGYVASSGAVTVPGPSRLIAHGEAVIVNAGAVANDANCRLALVGASDQRPFGNYVNELIGSNAYMAVGVSGGVDIDAGTYNVRVQCAGASLTFHRGNLIVTVSPR